MWLVGFILCLATFSEQGALKCIPDDKDSPCSKPTESINEVADFVVKLGEHSAEAECLAGSEWESNCHKCKCSDQGRAECSKSDTCQTTVDEEPLSCKPNTTFKRDCNTCACLDTGLLLCTLKSCESTPILSKPELSSGKNCLPGSRWLSKCNECFCTPDGMPACTEKACPEQENEPEFMCAPDTVWKNDCNTCWCAPFGLPTCTRIGCHLHIVTDFNPDGSDEADTKVPDLNNTVDHGVVKRNLANMICKPNTSFKMDCNFCDCDDEGTSFSCTDSECVESDVNKDVEVFMIEEEGVDHVKKNSLCKPRTTFYKTCNLCQCNFDGSDYSCTDKPCPLPKDVELFHEFRSSRMGVENATKVICAANRMFIMNCNTCWCNEEGTSYVCTRKVCLDEDDDRKTNSQDGKKKCNPNEVFELDCNTCRCNADGKSFSCTRRTCAIDEDNKNSTHKVHVRKTRATSQGTPKACQPGQEFRMDCNKCLCDNEGLTFSCTRIDCAAVSNNNGGTRNKREISSQMKAKCTPGSVFEQGCNVCRCTEDGAHATCTMKRCKINKEGAEEPEAETGASFRCNPGEQFKRGCNDCTCTADGKDVFCTLRVCEQDLTDI